LGEPINTLNDHYSLFPSWRSFFASCRSFSRIISIFFWYCLNWSRCFFNFC